MRRTVTFLILLAAILPACGASGQVRTPSPRWTVGAWFWDQSEVTPDMRDVALDSVAFHAGRMELNTDSNHWYVDMKIPRTLPKAKEYWAVVRFEQQKVPNEAAIPVLVERLSFIKAAARQRQLPLIGLQLDIDVPTGSLTEYADFLRKLRKALPSEVQLSITALLDWFRDGTAMAAVASAVDEFVPQFYDLSEADQRSGGIRLGASRSTDVRPIAAKIDPKLWAPRFNKYGKRYRIGISSFGRSALVSKGSYSVFGDLAPLVIGSNPAFSLQTTRTPAGEIRLKYAVVRNAQIGYTRFSIGDSVQFMIPTVESIGEAYKAAKSMGGFCSGVLFFRWPASEHEIALSPTAMLAAAGIGETPAMPRFVARDGGCAAVHCVDLHLYDIDLQASQPVRYTLTSSTPYEYFLPEKGVPARPSGPGEMEVRLPAFPGVTHIYLGRAVVGKASQFSVKKEN